MQTLYNKEAVEGGLKPYQRSILPKGTKKHKAALSIPNVTMRSSKGCQYKISLAVKQGEALPRHQTNTRARCNYTFCQCILETIEQQRIVIKLLSR